MKGIINQAFANKELAYSKKKYEKNTENRNIVANPIKINYNNIKRNYKNNRE